MVEEKALEFQVDVGLEETQLPAHRLEVTVRAEVVTDLAKADWK
jgi:hypothetical protein